MGTLETAVVSAETIAFFTAQVAEQAARVVATQRYLAAYAACEWWMPRPYHLHVH